MLCDKCGKKQATSYFKQSVNGNTIEMRLCPECAKSFSGFNDIVANPFDITNLFSNFLFPFENTVKSQALVCKNCSKSFDEIMADGKVGCSECYTVFEKQLMPTIEKLHGNATHISKVPRSAGVRIQKEHQIISLRQQLETAIKNEDFENAAVLRDKIKAITETEKDGEQTDE